jgi:hypothetical protein
MMHAKRVNVHGYWKVGGSLQMGIYAYVPHYMYNTSYTDLWTFPPRYRQVPTNGVVWATSQVQSWLTQANY